MGPEYVPYVLLRLSLHFLDRSGSLWTIRIRRRMIEHDPADVQGVVTVLVLELLYRAREEREPNSGQVLWLYRNERVSARMICGLGKNRLGWSAVNKDEIVRVGNFGQGLRKPPLLPGRVLEGVRQLKPADYQIGLVRVSGLLQNDFANIEGARACRFLCRGEVLLKNLNNRRLPVPEVFDILFRAEKCLTQVRLRVEVYRQGPEFSPNGGMSELRRKSGFSNATLHVYQAN